MPVSPPTIYKSHAPVINPFDKLTQNQFDSYVSNIQAKIQLALNPASPEPLHVSRSIAEISRSTIASPAPSPASLSKRPSLEPRALSKTSYTPLGAGTPNEPYELSDDDDESDEENKRASSGSGNEAETDAEPEPLSAIPEGTEEGDEMTEDNGSDEVNYSGDENENDGDPEEVAWDYSGEDVSEDEEQSAAEEAEEVEEEEDTFVGKGKGRHPAEGPGLAALLNGSGTHRPGETAQTPERPGHSSRTLDDSFEKGVGRMPALGTTSTPFISRLRSVSPHSQEGSEDEDEGSPPWEVSHGLSIPEAAEYQENESEGYESGEEFADEEKGPGAAREDAIEVLDSDEEAEMSKTPDEKEVDEVASPPVQTEGFKRPQYIIAQQELDELQFDDSAAYPDEGQEPDSLLDDTVDGDDSMRLRVLTDNVLPGPSSLFSASSIAATREPSQSKDTEELDQSADTVQAPEYSVEEPGTNDTSRDLNAEPEQPSMQQSVDYSDFIGEHSLLGQQDTSLTQAEQQFHEVTIYELENGSRYYDFDGVRHFLNPEGEVYQTVAIPPPKPTIQQPPDLSMIEEVTEYDITRKMTGADDDHDDGGAKFDFLRDFDDTFSSVGEPILHYPGQDDSVALGMDDIPQRPGAALGFRSRDAPGVDASAFLSDSVVLGDDLTNEHDVSQYHGIFGPLGTGSNLTGAVEESMGGRNADDLVSDDDLVSASEAGDADADDSQDSILDDDGDDTSRELDSGIIDREDLVTPVPPARPDESGMEGPLELDEKSVADALAAVAQLAENASFEGIMSAGGEVENVNDSIFNIPPTLDDLVHEVSTMNAEEEDILARSFSMADTLQSGPLPLTDLPPFDGATTQNMEHAVGSSVPEEINSLAFATSEPVPEKLASDVLAEVFEGVEAVQLPSVIGTRSPTPSGELEPSAYITEIEASSRSSTPRPVPVEAENQDPSPRRTPPTPTLSAGQSLTAPELSIATSISGRSGMMPNVSVYEGSPTSSIQQEDPISIMPQEETGTTQLPDPALPPSPTHLSMPAVPVAPNVDETQEEVSPSVVVEPPTPHTRSEDGTTEANTTAKSPEVELNVPTNDLNAEDGTKPVVVQEGEVDEEVDVVGLASHGTNTPVRRARTRSPNTRSLSKESNELRATPTPSEKIRAGDKRKRLEDAPSPASTPLKLSIKSPVRSNGLAKSPSSDAGPSPNTPTPRQSLSSFKRTPGSKPLSTTPGSRKTSGSDTAPAPWPMRHRIHRHTPATQDSSPGRRKADTSTGSPILKPRCRFHKLTISVNDKHTEKIEFIVPACALGHSEVLKERGAEDCGLSTPEEESAMVTDLGDVEAGAIDSLKAVVGPTLFDEGVCGYLPKSPVAPLHPAPSRLKGSLRGSISDFKFEPASENDNKAISPQTKPKPRSRPSVRHDDKLYKPPVEDESDASTEEEPTRKRPKHKKRESVGPTSSVKFPSLGQDTPEKQPERIPISKRMKRARRPADAQAYKPEPNQGESSPDDEAKNNPRKRIKHRATSAVRRMNSSTAAQESKRAENETEDPFKPKNEIKRVLSPEIINAENREQDESSALDPEPTPAEQKELEQHVELGDHPGEVVNEAGEHVDAENLPGPAPAKVAAYVDRNAPSEIGKQEANGAGENALGAKGSSKKGWSRFLRL